MLEVSTFAELESHYAKLIRENERLTNTNGRLAAKWYHEKQKNKRLIKWNRCYFILVVINFLAVLSFWIAKQLVG